MWAVLGGVVFNKCIHPGTGPSWVSGHAMPWPCLSSFNYEPSGWIVFWAFLCSSFWEGDFTQTVLYREDKDSITPSLFKTCV